jgi:hypothetical protein
MEALGFNDWVQVNESTDERVYYLFELGNLSELINRIDETFDQIIKDYFKEKTDSSITYEISKLDKRTAVSLNSSEDDIFNMFGVSKQVDIAINSSPTQSATGLTRSARSNNSVKEYFKLNNSSCFKDSSGNYHCSIITNEANFGEDAYSKFSILIPRKTLNDFIEKTAINIVNTLYRDIELFKIANVSDLEVSSQEISSLPLEKDSTAARKIKDKIRADIAYRVFVKIFSDSVTEVIPKNDAEYLEAFSNNISSFKGVSLQENKELLVSLFEMIAKFIKDSTHGRVEEAAASHLLSECIAMLLDNFKDLKEAIDAGSKAGINFPLYA